MRCEARTELGSLQIALQDKTGDELPTRGGAKDEKWLHSQCAEVSLWPTKHSRGRE